MTLVEAVSRLLELYPLESLKSTPIFDEPQTLEIFQTVGMRDLTIDADQLVYFNAKLTEVLEQYMEKYLKKDLDNLEYTHRLLIVLDLSILIGNTHSIKACPMQTLNTILLVCCPVDLAVSQFTDSVFANHRRRKALTLDNSLIGKAKPGSTLLQIGNNLLPKLVNQFQENDIFAGELRAFITNAIDINDRLSLASDWKINQLKGFYEGASKSRNWVKISSLPDGSPASSYVYANYLRLCLWFTTKKDIKDLIDDIVQVASVAAAHTHSRKPSPDDNPLAWLSQVAKQSDKLESSRCYASENIEPDWILDKDEFTEQLKSKKNSVALHIQLAIMIDFISQFNLRNIQAVKAKLQAKNTKYKTLPAVFNSFFTSEIVKRKLSSTAEYIYDENKWYGDLTKHLLIDTESTWKFMKIQQFNHPELTELGAISTPKKRKFDEYMHVCSETPFEKAKPYFHKMGLPRLSRVWKLQTGLDQIKSQVKDPNQILQDFKDDLYMAKGKEEAVKEQLKKEQDPENIKKLKLELDETTSSSDLLTWKTLRLSRTCGEWIK
ncbi:hypothetical protein FOA43_002760 [Brettanomyces nanus]|uniref:Uncharacterized protein n=1 Tax=Eeniella nana TaxID=13502 RepID=A0A875S232_EENNA|nr:uncharacterized protein FOA43_002760 [Brettanomyces nanus]QPG75406.1 hypothetical protein FOA43_002760 [Brettanomyces nanus]